jgi:hypothetical protein
MIKIDANKLKSFVKKASLNGDIITINLDFTSEGLASRVRDPMNVCMTSVFMKPNAFESYDSSIGEVFIKNSKALIDYLSTFSGIVSIEKPEQYMISIYGDKRESHVILGSELVCDNVFRGAFPLIQSTFNASIQKTEFNRTVKDMNLLGIRKMELQGSPGLIVLSVGEKGESDFLLNKIESGVGSGFVAVGDKIIKVNDVLDNDFNINFGTDIPCTINEVADDISFTCIIAPVIDRE